MSSRFDGHAAFDQHRKVLAGVQPRGDLLDVIFAGPVESGLVVDELMLIEHELRRLGVLFLRDPDRIASACLAATAPVAADAEPTRPSRPGCNRRRPSSVSNADELAACGSRCGEVRRCSWVEILSTDDESDRSRSDRSASVDRDVIVAVLLIRKSATGRSCSIRSIAGSPRDCFGPTRPASGRPKSLHWYTGHTVLR